MKRILILSDSHGDTNRCINIINKFENRLDAIIHAGDCVRDAEDLTYIFPDIPIHYVRGNNDIFTTAPSDLLVETGGVRIFITHGHEYRVKYELHYATLAEKAKAVGADLCVFGHTHIPYTDFVGSMTILNPGSIRFDGTYAIAEIEDGKVKTVILDY